MVPNLAEESTSPLSLELKITYVHNYPAAPVGIRIENVEVGAVPG